MTYELVLSVLAGVSLVYAIWTFGALRRSFQRNDEVSEALRKYVADSKARERELVRELSRLREMIRLYDFTEPSESGQVEKGRPS